jgi:hypothetical protein
MYGFALPGQRGLTVCRGAPRFTAPAFVPSRLLWPGHVAVPSVAAVSWVARRCLVTIASTRLLRRGKNLPRIRDPMAL